MANAISFVGKTGTLNVPYSRIEHILKNLVGNQSLGLISSAIPKFVNDAGEFVFRRSILPVMQAFDPSAGAKAIGMDNWTFEPSSNYEFDLKYQQRDLEKIINAQTLVNETLSGFAKVESARFDVMHIDKCKLAGYATLNFFNASALTDITKTEAELKPVRKYISVIKNEVESTNDVFNITLDSSRIWMWLNGLVQDQYIESLTPSAVKTQLEINGNTFTQINGLTLAKNLFIGKKYDKDKTQFTFDKGYDFSNLVCIIKHQEAIGHVYKRYPMQDLPEKGGKRFTYSADTDAIILYSNLIWLGLKTKPLLIEVNAARTELGLEATTQELIDAAWATVPTTGRTAKNEFSDKEVKKEFDKVKKLNPELTDIEITGLALDNLKNGG